MCLTLVLTHEYYRTINNVLDKINDQELVNEIKDQLFGLIHVEDPYERKGVLDTVGMDIEMSDSDLYSEIEDDFKELYKYTGLDPDEW